MKLQNAIKKLEKNGFEISERYSRGSGFFIARREEQVLEFFCCNRGEEFEHCIFGDEAPFYRNLKRAIEDYDRDKANGYQWSRG